MAEILFVLGFFFMLLMTGISLIGMIAAMVVGFVLMMVGGLFTVVIKMLPWLLLAIAVVWIYRAYKQPEKQRYKSSRYKNRRLP